jgi:N-methylhydantoinase B/oxoprolinase/acetone carboxylase alpha subunit
MDQLETISTLGIEELRKILQENDVRETGTSREDLAEQVSHILLTNRMIQEMMEEPVEDSVEESVEDSVETASPRSHRPLPRTIEREQQDIEYAQAVAQDTIDTGNGANVANVSYITDQIDQIDHIIPSNEHQMTLDELRAQRLLYYNNTA